MIHIYWTCPHLRTYWSGIFSLIGRITNSQFPNDPSMAILSLGIETIPHPLRSIVSHILISARLELVRHWKRTEFPTLAEIVRTTNLHITYEVIFAASQGSYISRYPIWKPWIDWYGINKNM